MQSRNKLPEETNQGQNHCCLFTFISMQFALGQMIEIRKK